MKKFISILAVVAFCVGFISCTVDNNDNYQKSSEELKRDYQKALEKEARQSFQDVLKLHNNEYHFNTHTINHEHATVYNFKHDGHQYIIFVVETTIDRGGGFSASVVHDPDCPCLKNKQNDNVNEK